MFKSIKVKLYPNRVQCCLMNQIFGCCRFIYNKGLEKREKDYKKKKKTGYAQTCKMLTGLKRNKKYVFLKEVDSTALQQSLRDLDRAYVNFFEKRAKHPRFKVKHASCQSYRTSKINNNIRIEGKYIRLPKVGFVKIRQTVKNVNILNVTVERLPSGKYFAVLTVKFEPKPRPNKGGQIGIDLGIKHYYTDSNRHVVENPKSLKQSLKQLARAQRSLSRKIKQSKNFVKQRKHIAIIYEKVFNRRNDFLQKLSSTLINENQVICIEDLSVTNMIKNKRLAREISDAAWRTFRYMLEYKSDWYGNNLVVIPTFYPSSQLCSTCGFKNPEVKNLAVRTWTCPQCSTKHDRDYNASLNILRCGLQVLAVSENRTAGCAG